MDVLTIENDNFFNFIIAFSILTRKNMRIKTKTNLNNKKSFLRLISKITKNTTYKIEKDCIFFNPGILEGGEYSYKCVDEISNYVEPLLTLIPFSESNTKIIFYGITNKKHCIDIVRIVHFTLLKMFEVPGLELIVKKRGFYPEGQGEVHLFCNTMNEVKCINLTEPQVLEKTRALLISARLNSTFVIKMSNVVKDMLGDLNLKVFTNIYNRTDSGPSPGFQCTLFSESKNGIFYIEEDGNKEKPEDVARVSVVKLLKSINKGGIFDHKLHKVLFSFLCLSSSNVSQIRISKISEEDKIFLGLLKVFFNFEYKTRKDENSLVFISFGSGYINYNKKLN